MKCAGMIPNCKSENITHIDCKGFVYCKTCGPIRKLSIRTKKLNKKQVQNLLQNRQYTFGED